jgi:hypothetical protein
MIWRRDRPQLSSTLVASLLSVLATLLAVLLTESTGLNNAKYAVPALYVFLIAVLAYLGSSYLSAYIADIKKLHQEMGTVDIVSRAIPTFVTFRRREDSLVINDNGDGVLTWEFELASSPDESITELNFPIFGEISPETRAGEWVEIELIEVNEQTQEIVDAYRTVERRYSVDEAGEMSATIVEYGLLRVPVELERGRDICRVRVRMRFLGVFPLMYSKETFFIDIPYITERLRVAIAAEGRAVRRSPRAGGSTLVAMSGLMNTVDPQETNRQNSLCRQSGPALMWETDAPKLGYRYNIYFRVEEMDRAADARTGRARGSRQSRRDNDDAQEDGNKGDEERQ